MTTPIAPDENIAHRRTEDRDRDLHDGSLGTPVAFDVAARPRLGPALIVLIVVATVIALGFSLALFGNGSSKSLAPATGGMGLKAQSARAAFAGIRTAIQPPSDIVAAIVVPTGSVVRRHHNADANIGPYDRSVTLSVSASVTALERFYEIQLKAAQWSQITTSPETNGVQIFARHASNDGYYWELGMLLNSANPSISPALSGGAAVPMSTLELRLFEVNDEE